MPIAVQVHRTRIFEDSVALPDLWLHPSSIVLYSTFPSVLECSDFITITPDDFVFSVGEEGWVRVNQVYGFLRKLRHYFAAVPTVDPIILQRLDDLAHWRCSTRSCCNCLNSTAVCYVESRGPLMEPERKREVRSNIIVVVGWSGSRGDSDRCRCHCGCKKKGLYGKNVAIGVV